MGVENESEGRGKGEWRVRDGGSVDSSEMGSVMKELKNQRRQTGIGASLTLDYRDKEESNNLSMG